MWAERGPGRPGQHPDKQGARGRWMKEARVRAKGCKEEVGILTSEWQVWSFRCARSLPASWACGHRRPPGKAEGPWSLGENVTGPSGRRWGELLGKSGVPFSAYKAAVPEGAVEDWLRFAARGEEAESVTGRMALERSDGHWQEI